MNELIATYGPAIVLALGIVAAGYITHWVCGGGRCRGGDGAR
jgi:hypothetical protein